MADYDYLFKLLLIGDSGVGKSCLLLRFTDDTYTESYISTIGVDFRIKTMVIDGKVVKLQMWDTAGQERFRTIVASYYRGSHGIIITFDVGDRTSFNNIPKWLQEIRMHAIPEAHKILVGNKCDIKDRAVSKEEGEELAKSINVSYIETSAKTSTNIDLLFKTLSLQIRDKMLLLPQFTSPDSVIIISRSLPIENDNCPC